MAVNKGSRSRTIASQPKQDELIERWIVFESPTNAYLRDYGVDVWAIIGAAGGSEDFMGQVAESYDVPMDAVRAAFAYYRRHPLQIDAKLESHALYHGQTWPTST